MALEFRTLDGFCLNGKNLAGWADLRYGASTGAMAVLLPLTLRRASAAPATPAQPRNALRHARWDSATTLPPVAFARAIAPSRSIWSLMRWVSGCRYCRREVWR